MELQLLSLRTEQEAELPTRVPFALQAVNLSPRRDAGHGGPMRELGAGGEHSGGGRRPDAPLQAGDNAHERGTAQPRQPGRLPTADAERGELLKVGTSGGGIDGQEGTAPSCRMVRGILSATDDTATATAVRV